MFRQRTVRFIALAVALAAFLMAGGAGASGVAHTRPRPVPGAPAERAPVVSAAPDVPGIDPDYIYGQLDYLATHFLHREAGYDASLLPSENGHDEFAAYWSDEIARDLQGFGPHVARDSFETLGWRGRPPVVPAFNVEVNVPGAAHPEQMIVIGCHYDGEASSTQSAFDDASGCAIELGVARAMAAYWRAHHTYPARSVRFVIFDAEEQGLFGSIHYVNATINGDLANVTAMINEEQSGIGYPVRFLGSLREPVLPFFAFVAPTANNAVYPDQTRLSQDQLAALTRFRSEAVNAIPAAFAAFQAEGFGSLAYAGDDGRSVSMPIFTPADTGHAEVLDDTIGSSDQIPFTLAGLPCATFVGNATYYERHSDGSPPPPWSYPYDQPQDTIQLMNIYAHDDTTRSEALALALGLGGMMTTTLLTQSDVLGAAAAAPGPLPAIGDVGPAVIDAPIALDASASYDPTGTGPLTFAWDFGDGSRATGAEVTHSYTELGVHTLSLTVRAPDGVRQERKTIEVVSQPKIIANQYANSGFLLSGHPLPNPAVRLPTAHETPPGATSSGPSVGTPLVVAILVALVVLSVGGIVLVAFTRRWRRRRARDRRAAESERRRRVAALQSLDDHEGTASRSPPADGDRPPPPA